MMKYESYLDLMKGSFTIVILTICSIFALKVVIEKYIVFQGIKERYINGFSLRIRQSLKDGDLQKGMAVTDAENHKCCLLYTSDAADEEDSVDLGGRRLIKK